MLSVTTLPELCQVPDSAPPYDCALHGTACARPEAPSWRAQSWPAQARPAQSGPVQSAERVRERGDSSGVCAGTIWPRQFAQAIVETLAGLRPFRQLNGWTTEQAQARIRVLGPLLRTDQRPAIIRVLASQPGADVAEVTVIAVFGARTRAIAMRFEHAAARPAGPGLAGRPARWLCTAIESG